MTEGTAILLLVLSVASAIVSFTLCLWMPRLGLLLSPLFSVTVSLCTFSIYEGWLVPGVVLGVCTQFVSLLSLLVGTCPIGAPSWPRTVAVVILLAGASLVVTAVVTGLTGPLGFIAAAVFFAAMIRHMVIARNARTMHLFSTLAAAMRQCLPLTTALEIEAGGVGGSLRTLLRGVNRWLTQGMSLSESLRRGYPQCPGFALAQVAVAEQVHQLPQAAEQIVEQLQRRGREMGDIRPVNPVYPLVVMTVLCLIAGGVSIFILPMHQDIMRGMGAPMPALSQWVFQNVGTATSVALPALVVVACLWLYVLLRPRDPDRPKLLSVLGDRVKWRLPAWRWFERNYAVLRTVTFLRMGLQSGQPVDRAIAQAARLDVNECYRSRLRRWLRRVQSGQDIAAAARDSGVGRGLAWAFDPANHGQTPAILDMLEGTCRSSYSYTAHMARYVFWPVVILGLAFLVGLFAVSVFLIQVSLIQHTMASPFP